MFRDVYSFRLAKENIKSDSLREEEVGTKPRHLSLTMAGQKPEMGNSFHGYIHEFPGIRVDCFDRISAPTDPRNKKRNKEMRSNIKAQDVELYLLTHAHDDHMKGLDTKSFPQAKIYCSSLTKEIVSKSEKYQHVRSYLKVLTLNERHSIPYRGKQITICLIPSYHCPGSVMFLVEGEKNVLLTGDVRAESKFVNSLGDNLLLFPYTTKAKALDNIYLDTTYGYREEPYIDMLDNNEGLLVLANYFTKYPEDDDIVLHYADITVGFEEVWAKMLTVFGGHIHSTRQFIDRNDALVKDGYRDAEALQKAMTTEVNSRFHICGRYARDCVLRDNTNFNVMVKNVINITLPELIEANSSIPFNLIEGLKPLGFTRNGHEIFKMESSERRFLKPKGSNYLLKDQILYFFSRHSSYEECRNLVGKFNVRQVYPIVESRGVWESGFQMQRHFGDLCTGTEFTYDQIYTLLYNHPPLIEHPPKTINKLELRDSFRQFFEKSLNDLPSFKGVMENKSAFLDANLPKEETLKDEMYMHLKRRGDCLIGKHQYIVARNFENTGRLHWRAARRGSNDDIQSTDNEDSDDKDLEMERINRRLELTQRSTHSTFSTGGIRGNQLQTDSLNDKDLEIIEVTKAVWKSGSAAGNTNEHLDSQEVDESRNKKPRLNHGDEGEIEVAHTAAEAIAIIHTPEIIETREETDLPINITLISKTEDIKEDLEDTIIEDEDVIHTDVDDVQINGRFLSDKSSVYLNGSKQLSHTADIIRQMVRKDVGFGFFGAGLSCCSETPSLI